MSHICGYCQNEFASESTLISHVCVIRTRYKEENTPTSKLGLRLYRRYYELNIKVGKNQKTFDDFVKSKFYVPFIRLARHIQSLKPIEKDRFIDWLFTKNIKEKKWCDDETYEQYIIDLLQKETVDKALERSISTMDKWATEENTDFTRFFHDVAPTVATNMIKYGKISPWVLYLADSADSLWDRLNEEQGEIISAVIDPKVWRKKFETNLSDRQYAKQLLDEAGL